MDLGIVEISSDGHRMLIAQQTENDAGSNQLADSLQLSQSLGAKQEFATIAKKDVKQETDVQVKLLPRELLLTEHERNLLRLHEEDRVSGRLPEKWRMARERWRNERNYNCNTAIEEQDEETDARAMVGNKGNVQSVAEKWGFGKKVKTSNRGRKKRKRHKK